MRPQLDIEWPNLAPRLTHLYPDRRGEVRFVTIYRLIKIDHAGDEGLGRCRNISDTGARIEIYRDLALNSRITIAFSATATVKARVVWTSGHEYGVAFDEPIDCMKVLGEFASPAAAVKARPPRLGANLPARIAYDGGTCRGVVSDISVRGMRIAGRHAFKPGLRVRVIMDGGRECDGVVRWSCDDTAGLMLLEPLDVEDLGSVRRLSSPF